MIESGFIDIDGQAFPPEAIEPLPEVSGSTCQCAMVRMQGRRLFLKRLRPELAGHPRYVELMRKEYDIGHRLNHPNLAHYISMGEDIDGPYLVTEFIDGETLGERIREWRGYPPHSHPLAVPSVTAMPQLPAQPTGGPPRPQA